MTFAERLRALRAAKRMNEAALAKASGVSFGAVHDYGLGRRLPSLSVAVKLAHALGVDCTAFSDCTDIGGESVSPPTTTPEPPKPVSKGKRK